MYTVRKEVDEILAARKEQQTKKTKQSKEKPETRRMREIALAANSFRENVLVAARAGNPYAKLLELDSEGAPAPLQPNNNRDCLRSEAYRLFWDFVVEQGFTPQIANFSNADGPGYGVGYSSDSDWIICYLKA